MSAAAVAVPVVGRTGDVAWSAVGTGSPVTVFAHGLGGSTAETRPLAARVAGTRVLLDFRGHGASGPLPGGWDYDLLADDLLSVADEVGADQAVGLSLGAGALLRALTRDPHRFDRLALVLPAALDAARADGATVRLQGLGRAIDDQDVEGVAALLLSELPQQVQQRRGVALLLRRRAGALVTRPAPLPLRDDRPLTARAQLAAVHAPVLVLAQEADPLHRLDLAQDLCAALPSARLHVLPEAGVFWTAPRAAQQALADHLGAS